MSNPTPIDSLLTRWLQAVTAVSLRNAKATILAAIGLAVIGVAIAIGWLDFKTNRLDLLSPHEDFNLRWRTYAADFGDSDDAVLILHAAGGRVEPALNALVERFSADDLPPGTVLGKPDFSKAASRAIHLATPAELNDLESRIQRLPQQSAEWQRMGAAALLDQVTTSWRHPKIGEELESREMARTVVQSIHDAVQSPAVYRSIWSGMTLNTLTDGTFPEYLVDKQGQLGFVMVRVERNRGVPDAATIAGIRKHQAEVRAEHPNVEIGLTGVPILEHDEMRSSQQDMGKSTALSLIGVAILFAAGFGGLRLPLTAVFNLALALCCCMGFITLTIGHLNILSVAFGAILVGLGVDFGIHLVSAYIQERHQQADGSTQEFTEPGAATTDATPTAKRQSERALVAAVGDIGPGLITGGLTSALAFATAGLTKFAGVAELGLIAGGGIILCMLTSLLVLPALIQVVMGSRSASTLAPPLPTGILAAPAMTAPRTILLLLLIITAAAASQLPDLRYDHNLLNMQPQGSESVQWERRLVDELGHGQWYALSICDDLDTLRSRREALLKHPSVQKTESVEPLLGQQNAERDQVLARLRRWSATIPTKLPAPHPTDPAVIEQQLAELERLVSGVAGDLAAITRETRGLLLELPANEAAGRIRAYDQRLTADLWNRVRLLVVAMSQPPPTLTDLPAEIVSRYVSASGKYLLKIHAAGAARDMDGLEEFVRAVEQVDPACTGHPVLTLYASQQMQQSFVHAAIYSLLAVSIVLMLDFRSIRVSLLAMLPMTLGLLQLMGLLSFLHISLNPANMIVLPLIMGIGIDDGVHVVHDYLRRQTAATVYRLGNATATAILVTSATTMVGFGSMMLARHQGIQSLGQVLTLGVFCCLFNSLTVLPALLAIVSKRSLRATIDQGSRRLTRS